MFKQTLTALSLSFGLSLVLSSASCGPTCPASEPNCGNSNASGGGDAGSDTPATCGLLTAVQKCMKAYCASASNPFCVCYKRGYNINPGSCKCIDSDTEAFCAQAKLNGDDGSTYDCAADSSGVSSICVTVN